MNISFQKWQGLGNDFIIIPKQERDYAWHANLAKELCQRRKNIGADQLVVLSKMGNDGVRMLIINPDGTEAEMCGNAARCVAKYIGWQTIDLHTKSGIRKAEILTDGRVRVDMGNIPHIDVFDDMDFTRVGVPHAVVFVDDFIFDWQGRGEKIENMTDRFPDRTNVNFARLDDVNRLEIRTWERSSGATLACGTGACASYHIARNLGKVSDKGTVVMRGGLLDIHINNDKIFMTGDAEKVYSGNLQVPVSLRD